jgi:hypothetical protein
MCLIVYAPKIVNLTILVWVNAVIITLSTTLAISLEELNL